MGTRRKALKIGWHPDETLVVDVAAAAAAGFSKIHLRTSRRNALSADALLSPFVHRVKVRDDLRGRGAIPDDERGLEPRENSRDPDWPARRR